MVVGGESALAGDAFPSLSPGLVEIFLEEADGADCAEKTVFTVKSADEKAILGPSSELFEGSF